MRSGIRLSRSAFGLICARVSGLSSGAADSSTRYSSEIAIKLEAVDNPLGLRPAAV